MNRKEFLVQIAKSGATAAGVAAMVPCCAAFAVATETAVPEGTPLQKKYDFAQLWVKRLMDNMDKELDPATRKRLMEACGHSCYVGAYGERKPPEGGLDGLVELIKKYDGPDSIRRDGNTIHFAYVGNPAGLKVADGWCLCPVVEKGPEGLSGSYCDCSLGYVKEMFSRAAGKPVSVELTESLKRGGKACRFLIRV